MRKQARRCAEALVLLGAVIATAGVGAPPAGAASPPVLHISKGPYHDGEMIKLSVGPNHFFNKFRAINVLECSDPGGRKANLPINISDCDGNTVQGNSILINKNGSWSETGYELFALPNTKTLGELPDGQPVCNRRHKCVLYIGENQENFTWPKMFSAPFTITSPRGSS